LSGTNKEDKIWIVKRDNTQLATITIPYTSANAVTFGAETTVDAGLPKTHMRDIAWFKSTNVWEYLGLADFFGEVPSNSPLWILNCTPNYRHIHVGSGTL
jgi:hypothetical protein